MNVVIVDYGVGNLGSIQNMLHKLNIPSQISAEAHVIREADRLILPGVGSFDHGMKNLHERNLISVLHESVLEKQKPLLGICLGMQLLASSSEEGHLSGLNWIPGRVVKFAPTAQKKVPHMGWNHLIKKKDHGLFCDLDSSSRFYFVHSYHLMPHEPKDVLAETLYGDLFCSIVGKGSVMGCQFHPEKSLRHGMAILKNFSKWMPSCEVNKKSCSSQICST